jgi:DNA anti-recombination protein RmuC
MSSSSVSFRISRHTQDLAETVHALSQRLVTMEQRLEALERQLHALHQQPGQAEEAEAATLAPIEANIERLLLDCRQLLADQPAAFSEAAPFQDAADGDAVASLHTVAETASPLPEEGETWAEAAEDGDPGDDELAAVHAA